MSTIKRIDKDSALGAENNLNIFDVLPTNVAVNKSNWLELLPIAGISQNGPFVFRLFSSNQWLSPKDCWLYLASSIERKTTTGDWVPIDKTTAADQHVGVVQNYGHSFIKTLKISINGVEIFDSGILYAYRAYMLEELGSAHFVRKGLHEASCYYIDDIPQDSYDNKGFKARASRFTGGQICETMVKLSYDLGRQENYLLSDLDIVFSIQRNSDDFLILAPDYKVKAATGDTLVAQTQSNQYRIRIHDIRLYVKCVDLYASLNNTIAKQLELTPAKYSYRKIELRSVFLGKGRTEIAHNVFTGVIPRRLVIGFVHAPRLSSTKQSPFVFDHANVRSISVEANSQTYPSVPYVFELERNSHYIRAFVDMYVGLGLDESSNDSIGITFNQFLNGWCFFVVSMTSTLTDAPGFQLIRNGTTIIKAQFSKPIVDEGYIMVVMAETDAILSIDSNRVLQSDSSLT